MKAFIQIKIVSNTSAPQEIFDNESQEELDDSTTSYYDKLLLLKSPKKNHSFRIKEKQENLNQSINELKSSEKSLQAKLKTIHTLLDSKNGSRLEVEEYSDSNNQSFRKKEILSMVSQKQKQWPECESKITEKVSEIIEEREISMDSDALDAINEEKRQKKLQIYHNLPSHSSFDVEENKQFEKRNIHTSFAESGNITNNVETSKLVSKSNSKVFDSLLIDMDQTLKRLSKKEIQQGKNFKKDYNNELEKNSNIFYSNNKDLREIEVINIKSNYEENKKEKKEGLSIVARSLYFSFALEQIQESLEQRNLKSAFESLKNVS